MVFKSILLIVLAIFGIGALLMWIARSTWGARIILASIFFGILWLGYFFGGILGAIGLPVVLALYHKSSQ